MSVFLQSILAIFAAVGFYTVLHTVYEIVSARLLRLHGSAELTLYGDGCDAVSEHLIRRARSARKAFPRSRPCPSHRRFSTPYRVPSACASIRCLRRPKSCLRPSAPASVRCRPWSSSFRRSKRIANVTVRRMVYSEISCRCLQ